MTAKPQFCRHLMKDLHEVYDLLKKQSEIVITTHQKPDGDAMGSSLGLYHFLVALGHKVTVISPTNWAAFLNWMPACEKVIDFEKYKNQSIEIISKANILFCLDFNIMHRTKAMEHILTETSCTKVLIDHHEFPQTELFNFGESNILKSSTSEMIYDFIIQSPFAHAMNTSIATCLYTGIMTDTGSFRFFHHIAANTPRGGSFAGI